MEYMQINETFKKEVYQHIKEEWGGPIVVTKGNAMDVTALPAFICVENGKLLGAAVYRLEAGECEIVVLFSLAEGRGVGGGLIRAVTELARQNRCGRVWLITTNDNTHAIRFYQKQGMSLKAVHINAMDVSRRLKPQIPLTGIDGIPIQHEFEFEIFL